MKRVTPYLKMRVLGAIEFALGSTNVERIKHVADIVFTDENDQRHQFTWRTTRRTRLRTAARCAGRCRATPRRSR